MFSRIKKVRKLSWVLVGWCALIVTWMVAGASSAQSESDCASEKTAALQKLCQDATDAGSGSAILFIALIGFFGLVFLSLIWFMSRPRPQPVYMVDGSAN